MIKQQCLVLDIETSPIEAYVWGLKDQNIALNQIKKDWSIMAWSAKWLDTSPRSIMYYDVRKLSELSILTPLWDLLNKADILITQNGKNFDSRRLNARFIEYSMKPPSPYKHLDTYKIAKEVADFTSHKLGYLTDKLCKKYRKLSHPKYPGMSLWTECLNGNIDAWNEMKKYNIHDVLSTEELYNNLKAWTPKSAPIIYNNGTCPMCGSKDLHRRGYEVKQKSVYQRLRCNSCGKWTTGERIKVQ